MKSSTLEVSVSTKWIVLFVFTMAIENINVAMSIVVPEEAEPLIKSNGSRSFINLKGREDWAERRELARTIPCLSKFVETYFELQPERIPVLLPEAANDTLLFAKLYLSALQKLSATYVFSGHLDPDGDHVTTLNGIVLFEDYEEFQTMQSTLINLCGRDCSYLVVLTRTFPHEGMFLDECSRLVEDLWDSRVANVVFLSAVGHTVLVARSLTFEYGSICTPARPVLVAECDEDSNWNKSKWDAVTEMYVPLRMNDCIVTVAVFDYPPFVSTEYDPLPIINDVNFNNTTSTTNNGILRLAGIEGLIVNILASNIKFVVAVKQISWMNATNIAEEVNAALWDNEEVDMVLGGLPWAPKDETVYTLPYEVVQIVWITPIRPNVSLQALVSPLRKNVWFAVIGLLVFASCVEFIMTRNVSFLEIFSLVIGIAWPRQPTILSSRIRFISWVIFGYILTQSYLASLAGQLMASSGIKIDTLVELADTSFEIGGFSDEAQLFEVEVVDDDDDDIDDNEINRIIRSRFKVLDHAEYNQAFSDLIGEKNDDMVLAVRMNVSSMRPSFTGRHVHRMKESLATYPLAFAVWRGMPYLSVLDKKISILIEGGIISYGAERISLMDGGYFHTDINESEGNLDLRSLVPAFLLLSIGYGLATLALLLETVFFHWRMRREAKGKTTKSRMTMTQTKRMPAPRMTGTKMDQRVKGKLPDVMDTKAWIEILSKQQQYRTPIRRQVGRKVHVPFKFVH